MAVLSNKSSSPIPGRGNPNARNSEIGNPMRRSFTGNPFSKPSIVPNPRGLNPNTPANSPAENPRRNSVSRESVVNLRDNEDKENSKAAKVRSPMGGSKGTKNFMSPTISAASKITPSPRKRILEERNETVRASVSFSDLKILSFGQAMSDSEHKKEEEGEETLAAPLVSATDLKAEPVLKSKAEIPLSSEAESELVNLDPSFKISPCSVPVIAPLDSDPLAPPYDPKTNYLSPRPRFLHYKPNPRVELFLNKAKEGKRLEDSFVSGSFSDTDATEEETTQSDDLLKESEDDVSSSEEVNAEEIEREQEEDKLIVSEPSPINTLLSPEEEIIEGKSASKPRSAWRSKLTALLIVLSIVCVSISVANSPVVDHSVFDGSSNFFKDYDHSVVLEFAKARLDGLAQKLGVWYENCVSFLSDLIFYLGGAQEIESLHYYNLTDLFEDVRIDGYDVNVFVVPTRGLEIDIDDEYEEKQVGQEAETSFGVEEETPEQQITSPVSEEAFEVPKAELVESDSGLSDGDSKADSALISVEVFEVPKAEIVELESGLSSGDFEADPSPISQADEAQPEVSEVVMSSSSSAEVAPAKEADLGSEPPTFDASSEKDVKSSEEVGFVADETEDNLSNVKVLGMALLAVLAAIGSTAFVVEKKGNNNPTLNAKSSAVVGQGFVTKKLDISPEKNDLEVKHSSWNYSGDYCPSEMSSFENTTSSYYNKKGLNQEAQSYERTHKKKSSQRRESMASSSMDSSMGSPSYGSFTTYEKIPTKNGHGDEEIITPVRRSSRFKIQITSPS